jgi:hypothetical protein
MPLLVPAGAAISPCPGVCGEFKPDLSPGVVVRDFVANTMTA